LTIVRAGRYALLEALRATVDTCPEAADVAIVIDVVWTFTTAVPAFDPGIKEIT